jgi:CheY-like chemotaxis protein/anti-sigma regulatory factor (Ser/Thr protein kinase)
VSSRGKDDSDPRHDLAGALHDVSNALTVILGWVAEARDPNASPESLAAALRIVEQSARSARNIARRAIGVAPPITNETDAADRIVSDTVNALAVEAQRANVTLEVETTDIGSFVPNAQDLLHVVTNLVLNAIAHTPPQGRVRLTVERSAERESIHVDVEDEGPGIPAGRRTTLFDGVSTRSGGAGVGLRHARALARANGGDVELLPTPTGAFFRVTWPRTRTMASVPPPPSHAHSLAGKRVLVLEDDPAVTLLLEAALGARGATVTLARTHAELTTAVAAGTHDAALIDLSPIAHDIAGSMDMLLVGSPGIDVVFITGSADKLPDAIASDDARWVRKPFEVSEIVAALGLPSRAKPPKK